MRAVDQQHPPAGVKPGTSRNNIDADQPYEIRTLGQAAATSSSSSSATVRPTRDALKTEPISPAPGSAGQLQVDQDTSQRAGENGRHAAPAPDLPPIHARAMHQRQHHDPPSSASRDCRARPPSRSGASHRARSRSRGSSTQPAAPRWRQPLVRAAPAHPQGGPAQARPAGRPCRIRRWLPAPARRCARGGMLGQRARGVLHHAQQARQAQCPAHQLAPTLMTWATGGMRPGPQR